MARPKSISDEELLDIARKCFFEEGPQVPTRKIAEKAGISQPALFKRFKNKDELFMAAIATKELFQTMVDTIAWIETHPVSGPFKPQLEELLERISSMLADLVPRMIALHTHSSGPTMAPDRFLKAFKVPPPVKMLDAITEFVKRSQERGHIQTDLPPRNVALNILGPLQGRIFIKQIVGAELPDHEEHSYITQTAQTLCNGFCENGDEK